jgi:hypothetical protein
MTTCEFDKHYRTDQNFKVTINVFSETVLLEFKNTDRLVVGNMINAWFRCNFVEYHNPLDSEITIFIPMNKINTINIQEIKQ